MLEDERRAVVCDLVRSADDVLENLARGKSRERRAPPPAPPDLPAPAAPEERVPRAF
jgi:hypothetical protein